MKNNDLKKACCSYDLKEIFTPFFSDFMEHHEEFWVMYLNNASKCIGVSKISQGGIDKTIVDIRIILQGAIKCNATSLVLCHNHPSNSVDPSRDDDFMTKKISEACRILDINMLDHIILANDKYYSFADEGRLNF